MAPAIGKKRDGCTLGCFRVEPMGLAVWMGKQQPTPGGFIGQRTGK